MMRLTIGSFTASAMLVACSEQPAAESSVVVENAAVAGMAVMAVKTKGTGTVTAIDPGAGKITLNHAPMPEANWPAMTMAFEATPEAIAKVKVGDAVAFDAVVEGSKAEVVAIRPQ